jgi:hypothetical protein
LSPRASGAWLLSAPFKFSAYKSSHFSEGRGSQPVAPELRRLANGDEHPLSMEPNGGGGGPRSKLMLLPPDDDDAEGFERTAAAQLAGPPSVDGAQEARRGDFGGVGSVAAARAAAPRRAPGTRGGIGGDRSGRRHSTGAAPWGP